MAVYSHEPSVFYSPITLIVDCNLVDCRDVDPSECSSTTVLPADPSNGRCCDVCGEDTLII